MYVCVCKAVTDTQIKHAINEGVSSRRELFKCLGVGGGCGKCNPQVRAVTRPQQSNLDAKFGKSIYTRSLTRLMR
jgi:bacterioferritin-associated ferredoxin